MNFSLSDEQVELRSVVRRFLSERATESETRRLMASDTGYDPAVWAQLAGQLGLVGLAVPEEYGGAGYGWVELGVVFEEMGRVLLCAPYFATVALAIPALLASGDEAACAELLPDIAAGERIATLALTEPTGRWDADGVTLRAEPGDGGWRLDGLKTYVPDGAVADLVLVVARSDAGISLFAVEGTASGLTRRALPTLDQTRRQAELRFDGVQARLVGPEGTGWAALNSCCAGGHRQSGFPVNGQYFVAQRFAIDWMKLDEDRHMYKGSETVNRDYPTYGQNAIAVADGKVASVLNGLPERVSGALPSDTTVGRAR